LKKGGESCMKNKKKYKKWLQKSSKFRNELRVKECWRNIFVKKGILEERG